MKNLNIQKNSISLSAKLRDEANKFISSKLKEYGLNDIQPAHGDILKVLFDEKEHDMSEIARLTNRTKPTITALIEKLLINGYVVRAKNSNDARVSKISLSQKAIAIKPTIKAIADELNAIVYKDFSEIEAEILERLLQKALLNFS